MQQITLKIDGMMCGMCESHINESIRNNFSVKKSPHPIQKERRLSLQKMILMKQN